MNEWSGVPKNLDKYVGMVYCVYEYDTGMKYVGIKKYWKILKYKPLKGKKRKRLVKRESDWRTYNTSSPLLQKKLKNNPNNYEKVILKNCKSVSEMKAWEAYIQLEHYIEGRWNELYNEVINVRMRIRK